MASCNDNGNSRFQHHRSHKRGKEISGGTAGSSVAGGASGFAGSAIALAVVLLAAAPQRARAANECGVDGAGQDTLTCSAASYATGITYTLSNGVTLNLDNPAMVVTGVTGASLQSAGALTQLTVNVTNVNTITTTGSAVTVSNTGTNGLASVNIQGGTLTTTGASPTVSANGGATGGNAQVTLTGGQILNTGANIGILAATAGVTGSGNATVVITGGSVQTSATAVQANITGTGHTGTSRITMSGGSVLSSGANGNGLLARSTGRGLSQVQMSGGTVAATGTNGDGVQASITSGTYAVDVSGGTVTGGSGFGAGIHTAAAGGGTVNIGAGAVINGGASGVALRDGDLNRDGVDETGGNAVITTAGTLNGAVVLGGGTDTLTITGGSISGSITGDGADALNFNLGANSFTHGAAISGMNGIVMNSGTVQLNGTVAANTLNVRGGMLVLGNTATITNTAVEAGTLAVNGTLTGAVNVLAAGRLQGTGRVGNTTASGTLAPGNSIGTLLVAGNYTGNGATLEIEGVFGGTGSPADRLVVTGNASGTTTIRAINTGGTGALTGSANTDGISIVQVGGTSTAGAFQLEGGYAAAGPYQYQLRMFDPASSAASQADPLLGAVPFYDYRLQSLVDASGRPVAVPQIAGYQAIPTGAVRYGASLMDSVHQRQGELREPAADRGRKGDQGEQREQAFFMRANGSHNDITGDRASGYKQDIGYLQVGGHVFGRDMADGATLRIGGALSYGQSKLEAAASSAKVDLKGTTFSLLSTYQTPAGWYLDGVAQLTDYRAAIETRERGRVASPGGLGLGLSLEGGYPMEMGGGLVFEPQAQLSYQKIKFDNFVDVDRVTVELQGGESLRGRVGGRLKKTFNPNTPRQWTLYGEGNLVHEFLKDRGITAGGVSFASDSLGTSAQLEGGIQAQLGVNTSLYASVGYSKGLSKGAADSWSGNLGIRIAF
jgi:outer membrane autotransporter protein